MWRVATAGLIAFVIVVREHILALLLIGLNHRTTPIELREKFYLRDEALYPVLVELRQRHPTFQETVIVSTCNRLEIYSAVRDVAQAEQSLVSYLCQLYGIRAEALRPHLYIRTGQAASTHLMRVGAGLDSMILGEAQILGQVSKALDAAATVQTSGTQLHRLFESALHAGKRARTETAISRHTTSVSHAAAQLVRYHFRDAEHDPAVLVIGAGEMAQLAAQAMVDYDPAALIIANRTYQHAHNLADELGAQAVEWSRLWETMQQVDAVICATGAPHTILHAEDMVRVLDGRAGQPLMMVDVAVPRDIHPAVDDLDCVTVYDIDALNNVVDEALAQRRACIPAVEAIIAEEADRYWQWLNQRSVVPVIKDLRQEVNAVVQAELDAALDKLDHLNEGDKSIVQRMAHRILNKVLHSPTTTLRQHAADGDGEDYAAMVRELFALDEVGFHA